MFVLIVLMYIQFCHVGAKFSTLTSSLYGHHTIFRSFTNLTLLHCWPYVWYSQNDTLLMGWFSGVWPSRSLRCVTMMFSEFCETTGLHGWKYLAKVKYWVFYWATVAAFCELKVKWKTLQVQTGDRWYYKVSSTLGFGLLLLFQSGPFCTVLYLSLWTIEWT